MPGRATAAAIVAVAVAMTGAAAACGGGGGGGGSDDRAAYVDAIAATSDPSGQTSEGEARCMAEVLVDAAGVEQLSDAVSPDEIRSAEDFDTASLGLQLDEAQGDAFYEGLQGCTADLKHEIVLSMVTPLGLSDAAVACVEEGLTDDVARDLTVSIFTQGATATQNPDLVSGLQSVITPCQTASNPPSP
jgi:hypothetical protein